MSEQMIVNVTRFETRIAFFESGSVTDVFIERQRDRGLVGNIYLGKVQRVLPGMQAAFVEIGEDKAAFLYVGDVVPPEMEDDDEEVEAEDDVEVSAEGAPPTGEASESADAGAAESDKGKRRKRRRRGRSDRRIEELLKQGQNVLVQVAKDAIGTKGPRVTCNISLPGRQLVFMPTHQHLGISRRITDEEERQRLREILEKRRPEKGGFVVRTASEGLPEEKLTADVDFLVGIWTDVEKRTQSLAAPALAQPELDLVLRCVRDSFTQDVTKLVIDDKATYEKVVKFASLLDPDLVPRIELYTGENPIFDHYGVESELARAMSRKVWLKSGGYLVIDQAEALTAIDVNTGKFVGKRNLEDTILKTNLEAVKEVAYQLRLRNIGGMVIIDFIDMESQDHRDKVLDALEAALKKDRARCNVVKISELGLVEMTRQRTRESLGRKLTETCWYCEGRGVLKSKRTVVYDIFRALERQASGFTEPAVIVHAHPEVVDVIYAEEVTHLEHLEDIAEKTIVLRPRGSFHQEQYDIFGTTLEAVRKDRERRSKKKPKNRRTKMRA